MKIGDKKEATIVVTSANTAKAVGSGSLEVFATPMMIALMEQAACECIDEQEGMTSVGTMMNVTHSAASPVGMEVRAVAEITAIEGRRVSFQVSAYDRCGLIGEGTHTRFLVAIEKFMSRTNAKNNPA